MAEKEEKQRLAAIEKGLGVIYFILPVRCLGGKLFL